jgi:hypothetical protein
MRLAGVLGANEPIRVLRAYREAAGPYAEGPAALHAVRYRFALKLSEAAWHQLLRHVRGTHFVAAPAGALGGVTVPPRVEEAGATEALMRAVQASEAFCEAVLAASPVGSSVAPYAVLNAHRRTVLADLDLWELDHLVRLRLRENAQWDVRRAVRALAQKAVDVHPFLRELWGAEVLTPLDDESA